VKKRGKRRGEMKKFLLLIFLLGVIPAWSDPLMAEMKSSLAIFPFLIEKVEDPARGAVCPVCRGVFRQGGVLLGSQHTLIRFLQEKIEAVGTFKILPSEKVDEVLSPSVKEQIEERPVPSVIQIGKGLNVDFILIGYLFRFEERIGSSLGAEKPASVAFDLHLYRLRDEKMVWTAKFDETQRPLSENLLKIGSFFRRRAHWLTAEELASVGLDEMLKGLPSLKELEEMS
jgi:hypothetical protein